MNGTERIQVDNHGVDSNKYHIVWCPKYRRKVLEGKIAFRLCHILVESCLYYRAEISALEIMPDPVHWFVEVEPQFGIHRLVKNLQGRSSHRLSREFPALRSRLPTPWTNSYFISTAEGAPRRAIQPYVANQKNV